MHRRSRIIVIALLVGVSTAVAGLAQETVQTDKIESARRSISRWDLDSARKSLAEVTKANPDDVRASVLRAVIAGIQIEYAQAREILRGAAEKADETAAVLAGEAWLCDRAGMLNRASQTLKQLLKAVESDKQAIAHVLDLPIGAWGLLSKSRRLRGGAIVWRTHPATRLALAQEALRHGSLDEAVRIAEKVLASNPKDADALRALHIAARTRGDWAEAIRVERKILQLDPWDFNTRIAFCENLESSTEWVRRGAEEPHVSELLDAARAHLLAERRQAAQEALRRAMKLSPQSPSGMVKCGVLCIALRRTRDAIALGRRASREHPNHVQGHLLLAHSLIDKHHAQRFLIGDKNWVGLYADQRSPRPAGIERLFTNYSTLLPHERRVVDRAAYPARHLLPRLVASDATHAILPLHLCITDLPDFGALRQGRTPDGRRWTGVRGASGKHAATGVETLWEAARGGFSTVAHELGHQVFEYGLTTTQRSKVETMYRAAVRQKTTLDDYSSTSASEYFAQSYEAFVSLFKRDHLGVTMRHTRDELRRRDLRMFAFIRRLARG